MENASQESDDRLWPEGSRPHKQWHSRGYLPHFDRPGLVQHFTFRLYDSVPVHVIERWKAELMIASRTQKMPADDPRMAEFRKRIASYEDAGHGSCFLHNDPIARLIESVLLHFDGERYRLIEWCVMPNHVHVLIEMIQHFPMSDIVHSWKSFSAKEANRIPGRSGTFWMADYFDRFVRDGSHLAAVTEYIRENPVKAGYVTDSRDWKWGSAAMEGCEMEREM